MMNFARTTTTLFVFLIFLPQLAFAASGTRYVTTASGASGDGSLKLVLQSACDAAGDDTILFADTRLEKIRIKLESPLVIPEDCNGTITLEGSSEVDTILSGVNFTEGGEIFGDSCILNVYSAGNRIHNLSFVKNELGAGICLFGRDNHVEGNRIGRNKEGNPRPNRYGIIVGDLLQDSYPAMDGSGSEILANQVEFNTDHGIWVQSENIFIFGNEIHENGGEGIAISGDASIGVEMSQNLTSQNYGSNLGIDLGVDGRTINDRGDYDEGSNDFLNYVDYFQAFPLRTSDGSGRYWSWGVASHGNKVEVYVASQQDWDRGAYHAGGEEYLGDKSPQDMTFDIIAEEFEIQNGDILTFLTFDENGNTSEFAFSVPVGEDSDLDGIINEYEVGGAKGSSLAMADTDSDGLADAVEDKNRNGVWDLDLAETSSFKSDSDEDGVSDFYEVRADNFYNPGLDTDPLYADSDADGLADGLEDKNGNGILEVYLNETDPLSNDTDRDGFADHVDNCSSVYNPAQNAAYCQE